MVSHGAVLEADAKFVLVGGQQTPQEPSECAKQRNNELTKNKSISKFEQIEKKSCSLNLIKSTTKTFI